MKFSRGTGLVFAILFSLGAQANLCEFSKNLSSDQCEAVRKLKNLKYAVIVKDFTIDGKDKTVVALGETHVKPKEIALIEREFVDHFNLRLLEGYVGNGDRYENLRNSLFKFGMEDLSKLYQVMERSLPDFEPSTIKYALEQGFLFDIAEGGVYYNSCRIGSVADGSFYSGNNLQNIISSWPHETIGSFFTSMKVGMNSVKSVRFKLLKNQTYYRSEVRASKACNEDDKNPSYFGVRNIHIEGGKESLWKNYCSHSLCTYNSLFSKQLNPANIDQGQLEKVIESEEFKKNLVDLNVSEFKIILAIASSAFQRGESSIGVPGLREVFMGSNVFEYLKQADDTVGLVLVGSDHLGFFDHFFSQTNGAKNDKRSLWETEGLPLYERN